jgi:AbrB family looped-hinge helix DNA binding protein
MPTATLTSKGQTTIPREVRDFLKLKPGDKLEFKLNVASQSVELKAANIHISSLRGMLKTPGMKPYNPDERSIALRKRARRK